MATKKVSKQKPQISPDDPAEILRKEVLHLLIDHDLFAQGDIPKIAALLSKLMNKKIGVSTVALALSGYRRTPAYINYLTILRNHLRQIKPPHAYDVTIYTKDENNQENKEESDA